MFRGEFFHNIDAKGRVVLPSQLREGLGEKFVITCGYDGCLSIYSQEEWSKFEMRLAALPEHNAAARRIVRTLTSGASSCEADKQGRILIPQPLREIAGIEKEVVIIGSLSKIELWSLEKWKAYTDSEDALSLEEAAEKLSGLGGF